MAKPRTQRNSSPRHLLAVDRWPNSFGSCRACVPTQRSCMIESAASAMMIPGFAGGRLRGISPAISRFGQSQSRYNRAAFRAAFCRLVLALGEPHWQTLVESKKIARPIEAVSGVETRPSKSRIFASHCRTLRLNRAPRGDDTMKSKGPVWVSFILGAAASAVIVYMTVPLATLKQATAIFGLD
jgi:hypothetical protein